MRLLPLALGVAVAACGDYLSGPGLTDDPNNILVVDTPAPLYRGIQRALPGLREGTPALFYLQQVAGIGRGLSQVDAYRVGGIDMVFIYGGGGLLDIRKMQQIARRLNDSLYIGLAKVYAAIAMGYAAANLGDIPYREAADSTIPHPRYDPQLQLYADLQAELDSAITIFLASPGPSSLGTASDQSELIYAGRSQAELRSVYTTVARSLKARFYLHVAAASAAGVAGAPAAPYDSAFKYATAGIGSPADDFVWFHDASSVGTNGWLSVNSLLDLAPGAAIIEILKRRIAAGVEDDRRIAFYFAPADDGEYRGYRPAGLPVSAAPGVYDGSGPSYSTIGDFINPELSDGSFGSPELTYAETQLIAAEAVWQLTCAGCPASTVVSVAQPFLDAARTNRRYGSAHFGTAPGTLPASLQNIIEEKYLTLFLNPEVWNDWQRTCLPSLAPALGAPSIPGRLPYSEENPNQPTISSVGVPITSVSRNPTQPAACPALNYTTSVPLAN